jgi:hypothetical protein
MNSRAGGKCKDSKIWYWLISNNKEVVEFIGSGRVDGDVGNEAAGGSIVFKMCSRQIQVVTDLLHGVAVEHSWLSHKLLTPCSASSISGTASYNVFEFNFKVDCLFR